MRKDYVVVELACGPCQRQDVMSTGIWMEELFESFKQGYIGYGFDNNDKRVFMYLMSSDPGLKIDDLEDGGLAFGQYEEDGYFLKLSKAKADKFFREWYEIMKKKPARIGIWSDGENLRIRGSGRRAGISMLAAIKISESGYSFSRANTFASWVLMYFVAELEKLEKGELEDFLDNAEIRETKIAGFDLAKKLWKISISRQAPYHDTKSEVLVTRKELLKVIDDFHAAMATKPDQIAIVRDNRGLIVVTEKTVEDLLF